MTWDGRQLMSFASGQIAAGGIYTYNSDGVRIKNDRGYTVYYYEVDGTAILSLRWDGEYLYFLYDAEGGLVGMQYCSSTVTTPETYWYEKNLQGDIIGVYDSSGNRLLGYGYDAWGRSTVSYYSYGSTSNARYNPFRYRGYYYDEESGFYYCNSRYYDSDIGRFISADTWEVTTAPPMGLTDKNLYAYCDNNPAMRADKGGMFWHILIGAAVGAVIGAASKLITNVIEGKEDLWDGVLVATVSGAASGALAATGVGVIGQMLGGAGIAAAGNATQQTIDIVQGEKQSFSVSELLLDSAIGSVSGLFGGAGASQGNTKTAWSLGKQLTKRIFKTGDITRAFSYYGKNMMNGFGNSIYSELGKGLTKSGISGLGFNFARSIYGRWFQ